MPLANVSGLAFLCRNPYATFSSPFAGPPIRQTDRFDGSSQRYKVPPRPARPSVRSRDHRHARKGNSSVTHGHLP